MLASILEAKEDAIAERWIELVFATYPQETTQFLKGERDPFSNPVGQLLREAATPLVRALSTDRADPEFLDVLAKMMRVRSVQDLTASQAVAIVPLLRTAVLEEGGRDLDRESWFDLVGRVERLTMAAFNVFVSCREELYEVRTREMTRRQASLLRRAEQVLAGQLHDPAVVAGSHEDSQVNQRREV